MKRTPVDSFVFRKYHGFEDPSVWQQASYVPWSKAAILGMVIQPLIGNPYNGYINPYYWVDDHPLLYGNIGSLDPSTYVDMYVDKLKVASPKALEAEETRKRRAELDDQCGRLQILRDRWALNVGFMTCPPNWKLLEDGDLLFRKMTGITPLDSWILIGDLPAIDPHPRRLRYHSVLVIWQKKQWKIWIDHGTCIKKSYNSALYVYNIYIYCVPFLAGSFR